MNKLLACDIDATIWDFHAKVIEALEEEGHELSYEDLAHWNYAQTALGYEASQRAYGKALDPELVPNRELYPGVRVALNKMKELGYDLVFVTHNSQPDKYHPVLHPWLQSNFGDCELHVCPERESKVDYVLDRGGSAIIDDKPQTLEEAVRAKLWVATLLHPWNREVVKKNRGRIMGFKDWHTFQNKLGLNDGN